MPIRDHEANPSRPVFADLQPLRLAFTLSLVLTSCQDRGEPSEFGRTYGSEPTGSVSIEWPVVGLSVVDTLWTAGVFEGVPEEEFGKIASAAFDGAGNVYLLDVAAHSIRVFDRNGLFLTAFGGSGTGPGELAEPKALLHDGGETLYLLDSVNGLMAFQISPKGVSHARTVNLATRGVEPTDFCLLGDSVLFFGLSGAASPIQVLLPDGELGDPFGDLFGGPAGHPVQQYLSRAGEVACSSESDVVLALSRHLAEIRAYRASTGELQWSDTLPGFAEIYVQADPAGLPSGFYNVGEPPGGNGRDRNVSLLRVTGDVFLAQSRRVPPSGPANFEEVIKSCLIRPGLPVCAARSEELPLILAISGDRAVAVEERVFPVVHLLRIEKLLRDSP